ncbi:MAG: glycosyltransferase, partial [Coriobacteriia bacterium]|nr:glycosyltransferase [Coriobacteriia bacterium]
MNILSVNASVIGGGAEKVSLTLHQRYRARGHESWLAVANINAEEPGTLQIPRDAGRGLGAQSLLGSAWWLDARSRRPTDAAGRASRALRVAAEPGRWAHVARGHEDFDFPWTSGLLDLAPARADVLHLHNLHGGYFDIRVLPELTAATPTVLTLHDTWLLTGHCAQPFECERWRTGCGACPDLDRYVPVRGEETIANREVKRSAVLGSRLGIAAPSAWLLSMAEESGLLGEGREGRVIPNGVDTSVFAPGHKAAARERLRLPQERRIALVAAKGVRGNPYKGFDTLLGALGRLSGEAAKGLLVVALGDEGQDWV